MGRTSLKAQQLKAQQLVKMAMAEQQKAGAAPEGAGYEDPQTQGETKVYMRRLEDGYREVNAAIVDLASHRPPKSGDAWTFINNWYVLYAQWEKFYTETIDDWMITTDDATQANDYGERLQRTRNGYEKALGEKPPGAPVEQPKQQGGGGGSDDPASTLDQATSLLKWGVVAFVVFKLGSTLLSKDKD